MISLAIGTAAAFIASGALAQSVNLTGKYRCIQMCQSGLVGNAAYVTQNGTELNLLNEAGVPSRAWPDWFAPENRIWVDDWNESAVYSPDGMRIQFDNGAIWERDLTPERVALRRRR